ncbi:MAG TPA: hypothetical protein VF906_04150 [Candidatus Bathyarchaeia archaeon]
MDANVAGAKAPLSYTQNWAMAEDQELTVYQMIVSNRHQMGKSSFAIRAMEKVEEEVHGRKYDPENFVFTNEKLIERFRAVGERTPLGLDEPERPAGNRNWHTQENQDLVEFLMTNAYEHKSVLFPLPHSHFLDNAIVGICTSQVVVGPKGHARLYGFSRDMLNRSMKPSTPLIAEFDFEKPYAWDWLEYLNRKREFNQERGKVIYSNVQRIQHLSSQEKNPLTKDEVFQMVFANQSEYRGSNGNVSASMVEAKIPGISYATAQSAAKRVNLENRGLENAERQV